MYVLRMTWPDWLTISRLKIILVEEVSGSEEGKECMVILLDCVVVMISQNCFR